MKYINSNVFSLKETAVALGKFEGLHRGHQLLFQQIIKQKEKGLQSVVFTFDMPPGLFFHKLSSKKQLFTRSERYQILMNYGIDVLIEYPFTMEFASLEPEAFIRDVLVGQVGAKTVVVGEDFKFGRKRSGTVKDLEIFSGKYGYDLIIIPKLQQDERDISSSRIKMALEEGDIEFVNELLGRNYSISGTIVHGKALGRTIQIPTANQIPPSDKALPPNGVYYSKIDLDDKIYYGITNIGTKPTVESESKKGIESFIFDYDGNLYGRNLTVELLHFCRNEMKFDSLNSLVTQMKNDINTAKEFVEKYKNIVYN